MARPNLTRVVLAGLLAGSAVLFAFATSAERSQEHAERGAESAGRAEPAPLTTATPQPNGGSDQDHGDEHRDAAGTVETTTPPRDASSQSEAHAEKAETLFGIKTESTATTVVAVALSLVAATVAIGVRRRWLWPIVAFAAALGILDGREAAHQANLGHGGLEILAAILALAHAAAAVVAIAAATGRGLGPANRPLRS